MYNTYNIIFPITTNNIKYNRMQLTIVHIIYYIYISAVFFRYKYKLLFTFWLQCY